MTLPPHIASMLAGLRNRAEVPATLFETFEALKSLDPGLPLDERWYRWEAAMDELRRMLISVGAACAAAPLSAHPNADATATRRRA